MFLFITTGVFGQPSFTVTEFSPQLYFKYSLRSEFTYNEKQYAFAYDSVWIETSFNPYQKKNVYLWHNDGEHWTRVSDVLRTDYVKEENGEFIYDCWVDNPRSRIENKSDLNMLFGDIVGYSSIEIEEGVIIIEMLSFSGIIGKDEFTIHRDTLILLPKEDGTFKTFKSKNYDKRSSL